MPQYAVPARIKKVVNSATFYQNHTVLVTAKSFGHSQALAAKLLHNNKFTWDVPGLMGMKDFVDKPDEVIFSEHPRLLTILKYPEEMNETAD